MTRCLKQYRYATFRWFPPYPPNDTLFIMAHSLPNPSQPIAKKAPYTQSNSPWSNNTAMLPSGGSPPTLLTLRYPAAGIRSRKLSPSLAALGRVNKVFGLAASCPSFGKSASPSGLFMKALLTPHSLTFCWLVRFAPHGRGTRQRVRLFSVRPSGPALALNYLISLRFTLRIYKVGRTLSGGAKIAPLLPAFAGLPENRAGRFPFSTNPLYPSICGLVITDLSRSYFFSIICILNTNTLPLLIHQSIKLC